MRNLENVSSTRDIVIAIGAYSLCSSTMLLANKMTLFYLPMPAAVSFIQLTSTVITVLFIKYVLRVHVDDIRWEKLKPYLLYIVAFVTAIYCNMRALEASNVETVIVFRACTPLATSIIEYLFMGREMPSLRSFLSLFTIAIGAIAYCSTDSEFDVRGFRAYYWVSMYFILIVLEMTYGKSLTRNVKMDSVWGPVLYVNCLAFAPMGLISAGSGDFKGLTKALQDLPIEGLAVLSFSCVVGTLIGYTGWKCRGMISASSYTLVGVCNKFLTILLNVTLWNKHASASGLSCVCVCLTAGFLYQQAPRKPGQFHPDDEVAKLMNSETGDKNIDKQKN